jgi:phosphopantothenoylcysteine synthetase/decarboxylase
MTNDPLTGREVVVAVCGGIAAYKVAAVVSGMVQRGCGVSVAMTRAARRFVTPLTFEALSGRKVHTGLWKLPEPADPQHLKLTESAELFILAPATANMIGKIAHGIADDLVSTMVMSVACQVLLAPAMNTRMWENPIVVENVEKLRRLGYEFVGPGTGWQACRTIGPGRMAEPDEVIAAAGALLARRRSPAPE